MTRPLPAPTADLDLAKRHMEEFGYCMLKDALTAAQVLALKARLFEQREAERQAGLRANVSPDGKELVVFLLNKGAVFRDVILHAGLHDLVGHVLGHEFLLSSYHAHLAHPGSKRAFHTDQFWMPPPTDERKRTLMKPGAITRSGNRGHHVGGEATLQPKTIAPAVVCNAMWMLTDFRAENGATLVVPGSHKSGRQPDSAFDANADWVPAVGPAGTAIVFEGRTWHSTGENKTDQLRIGLTTNFCAPQFRQQENYLLGTRPEVLDSATPELLKLIGFKPWQGYGGYQNGHDWNRRGVYALGEMRLHDGAAGP